MSVNNINNNERSNSGENKVTEEEIFKIPRDGKVINANYRDDNEEMAKEIDEEIGFETFKDENKYKSPSDDKIADINKFEDEKRLSEIIKRAKAQKIGARVFGIYTKAA